MPHAVGSPSSHAALRHRLWLAAVGLGLSCGDAVAGPAPDASEPGSADAGAAPIADGGALRDAAREAGGDAESQPEDAGRDGGDVADSSPPDAGASLPLRCTLPPESGSCLAYLPRWAFNPALGACERFVWGGCGGNESPFERATECLDACVGAGEPGSPRESACMVGDVAYPSGATGIPDPHSCNTCTCLDGELTCTEIGCPTPCPPNSVPDVSCAACGPTDACQVVEYGCFTVCSDSPSCLSSGRSQCLAGVCKDLCG